MKILKLNKALFCNGIISLFIFVLLVDPANKIFGLKIPLFGLVLFSTYWMKYKISDKVVLVPIIAYMVIAFSSIMGMLFQHNTDYSFLMFFIQGFLMLFLLYWSQYFVVIEKCILPGIVISIVVSIIYSVFFLTDGANNSIIYNVVNNQYEGTIMISTRYFLGNELATVYYSSAPIFLLVFGFYLYKYLDDGCKKNLYIFIILSISIIIGGTRMLILSWLGIVYAVVMLKMRKNRNLQIFSLFLILVGVCAMLFLVILLLSEKGESSLDNKTQLLNAFYNHISIYPETLLFGNGVGATFDSLGVRGVDAVQSEWTYLELVRWFGLPLGLLFLSIYLYPILLIFKKKKYLYGGSAILISYVFYLLLAGTNPYLYSSNGMLALLLVYSYALNPHYCIKNNE